jgi:diguanylate cyclase (GGDEF)-like protein
VAGDDKQTIVDLRGRLAEYVLAVDLLSRMAKRVGESGVVDDILELLVELFAPLFVSYTPVVEGRLGEPVTRGELPEGAVGHDDRMIPAQNHSSTESGDGFVLRLDHGTDVLGVISVEHLRLPEQREHYLDIVVEIAELLALVVYNARAYDVLARSSATDELTDLPNRRRCFERLQAEFSRFQRLEGILAVAMLDLDHFKRVNDEHGHHAGDVILGEAARRMRACVRPYDVLARIGGEEFLLVAPETGLDAAAQLAERLRRSIADRAFDVDGVAIHMTISCGVAVAMKRDPSVEALVERADRGLYAAKRAGRDRVTVVPADDDPDKA